jgi:hypothetical protein
MKQKDASVKAAAEQTETAAMSLADMSKIIIKVFVNMMRMIVSFQLWDKSNPAVALFQVRLHAMMHGKRIGNVDKNKATQHIYMKDSMNVSIAKNILDTSPDDIDAELALFAILSILDGGLVSKKTAETCKIVSENYDDIKTIVEGGKITVNRFAGGQEEIPLMPKEYYDAIAKCATTIYPLDTQSAKLRQDKKGNPFIKG